MRKILTFAISLFICTMGVNAQGESATTAQAEAEETDKNPAENEFSEILKQRIYRQEEDEE